MLNAKAKVNQAAYDLIAFVEKRVLNALKTLDKVATIPMKS
jgi:hypothetical protein